MGGFIRKLLGVDDPPPMQNFSELEPPSYEDEARDLEERRKLIETEKKRKGRRSTILTGGTGLNEIEEENLKKDTLLGG